MLTKTGLIAFIRKREDEIAHAKWALKNWDMNERKSAGFPALNFDPKKIGIRRPCDFKEKECTKCGEMYKPTGSKQRMCTKCSRNKIEFQTSMIK